MTDLIVLDAGGLSVNLLAAGAGTPAGPFIPAHYIASPVNVNLLAGTNNVGDFDALSLVGDNADLDSDVGTDSHAVVAWGLPAAGGHVVGGTPTNPIRIDTVASTIQRSSIASWFPGADVVASVVGNVGVTASVIGVPNVLASIPNVANIAIQSQYIQINVTASMVGNAAVTASVVGVANVVASVVGQVNTDQDKVMNEAGTIKNVGWYGPLTGSTYPMPIAPYPFAAPQLQFTMNLIQVNGSGVVAANVLASNAARIVVVGYQIISTGTTVLAFYDGTINAPLTGSLPLIPSSGAVVPPGLIPLMLTTSGRGLTIGLSASCNIGGAVQYYVG